MVAFTAETGTLPSAILKSFTVPFVTETGDQILGAREEARTSVTLALACSNEGPLYAVAVETVIDIGLETEIVANVASAETMTICEIFQLDCEKKSVVLSVLTVRELVAILKVTVTPAGGIAVKLTGMNAVEPAPPSVIVNDAGSDEGLPLSSIEGIKIFAGVASSVVKTTEPDTAFIHEDNDFDVLCTFNTQIMDEKSPAKRFAPAETETFCV
jgi:hypothetical protein